MGLFDAQESLLLTITFAGLSGLFLTVATASTHYPTHVDKLLKKAAQRDENNELSVCEESRFEPSFTDNSGDKSSQQEKRQEKEVKKRKEISPGLWRLAYAMNLFFAAVGGTLNLIGTWFGPVSLFVPIKQVSQIISGMILFSYVLKTEEKPSKDTSVGNYIIMLSAIALIFVGPKIREEPIDVEALFSQEKAKLCAGVMVMAFGVTFPFQFLLSCTKMPTTDRVNFIFLLLTEVISAVVGNSTSKLLPLLPPRGMYFIINLVLLVLSSLTVAFSSILRSTVIEKQTEYLPLMLSANIFLNGIVGLILWEDNIINIGGYTCMYFFFVLGVYLVSDYGYEILPGTPIGDQPLPDNQNAVADGLIHGRARIIHSERNISTPRNIEFQDGIIVNALTSKCLTTSDETLGSSLDVSALAGIIAMECDTQGNSRERSETEHSA